MQALINWGDIIGGLILLLTGIMLRLVASVRHDLNNMTLSMKALEIHSGYSRDSIKKFSDDLERHLQIPHIRRGDIERIEKSIDTINERCVMVAGREATK